MIHEILSPGMQNANDAYLCPNVLRVIGEFRECFG